MREYETTFKSCNSETYPKPITAYVVVPDQADGRTGLMHFAHGWGGNRYGYREMQQEFADRYNLVCVATEFRQSGYDFDPVAGLGSDRPYDASHYQVLDCLNALRHVLGLHPELDDRRILSFGGSQGGHVAMLMALFCPATFALAIGACGLYYLDEAIIEWAGRDFSEDELAARDAARMAPRIQCPLVLVHGTEDETVPVSHTRQLEAALREAGKSVDARYIEGADHALAPVTNRRDATVELADELTRSARREGPSDFAEGTLVRIPCVDRALELDWSKPMEDVDLMQWKPL
jgi:dienelactone hydrolase